MYLKVLTRCPNQEGTPLTTWVCIWQSSLQNAHEVYRFYHEQVNLFSSVEEGDWNYREFRSIMEPTHSTLHSGSPIPHTTGRIKCDCRCQFSLED